MGSQEAEGTRSRYQENKLGEGFQPEVLWLSPGPQLSLGEKRPWKPTQLHSLGESLVEGTLGKGVLPEWRPRQLYGSGTKDHAAHDLQRAQTKTKTNQQTKTPPTLHWSRKRGRTRGRAQSMDF